MDACKECACARGGGFGELADAEVVGGDGRMVWEVGEKKGWEKKRRVSTMVMVTIDMRGRRVEAVVGPAP